MVTVVSELEKRKLNQRKFNIKDLPAVGTGAALSRKTKYVIHKTECLLVAAR